MTAPQQADTESLLLNPFPLANQKIKIESLAGGGGAGYVCKVNISDHVYALKMFKFDHHLTNISPLRGTLRRAFYDAFFIECRANGALIQKGLNGQITPFCYGWLEVPKSIEIQVARRFNIQPFLWDRPDAKHTLKVRGILFEWVDGDPISRVPLSFDLAAQARADIQALHHAGIIHGDLRASNILVQGRGSDQRVRLLDLSASITLPHVKFSAEDLVSQEQMETRSLELGFMLLSELSINEGIHVADNTCLQNFPFTDVDLSFIRHLWTPPRPTCWQKSPEPTDLPSGINRDQSSQPQHICL